MLTGHCVILFNEHIHLITYNLTMTRIQRNKSNSIKGDKILGVECGCIRLVSIHNYQNEVTSFIPVARFSTLVFIEVRLQLRQSYSKSV